jgi:NAD(P)-dependent dehydrogenase (short-subunit alcohol dehydrogenase family)
MPTVFVTGANRGLGLEFARQYAGDGWRVIATCRDPKAASALHELGDRACIRELDVTDRTGVFALAHQLEHEAIDVFIANAGTMTAPADMSLDRIVEDGWLTDFRTNVIGSLSCAAAFRRHVARSSQRKMLAMTSGLSSIGGNCAGGQYAYRSTKSALNAVWRSFAVDHPDVIAAVLAPGPLKTDMTRYDPERWRKLPEPAENIGRLRRVIDGLTQADSGGFFRFDGTTVPW